MIEEGTRDCVSIQGFQKREGENYSESVQVEYALHSVNEGEK